MTGKFTQPILLQKYQPEISRGEVRLWFLDGMLLAQARKLPLPHDFRVNIDRGSRLVATLLTAREKKVAAKLARHLRSRGIRLAAVDLIGGLVTDFNFTSPGLLVQMEQITGKNLAGQIIQSLAKS